MIINLDCTDLCGTRPDALPFSPILCCEVVFSSRKTLAVQIKKDARIIVRAPLYTGRTAIEDFLSAHRQWIFTHYVRQAASPSPDNAANAVRSGDILRFYDQEWILQINQVPPCNHASVYVKDGRLVIDTPEDSAEFLHDCLAHWYKKNGKPVFVRRADYWAGLMHVSYKGISVKEQKTRWGSCSSAGNLNFNWKLLLMEPRLLDYVVVHELAHLLEMNHSAAFWKIVETYIPDYRTCQKALK